jgi:hypothetical protein
MGTPICTHATADLAYEMTNVNSLMGNLYYFYIEVIFSEEEFAAEPVHQRPLPNNRPQLPLPPSLAPNVIADYLLLRSITPA